MNRINLIIATFFLMVSLNNAVCAENRSVIPFVSGSYQQLLNDHADQSYVLVIWSITCSSCIKEMEMLREVHQEQPELKLVMLSVDDISEHEEVSKILSEKGIADLESWVFAEANTQRLRYEIDPAWYGEIPRIYFFDAKHQRQGFSGKMTKQEFVALLN